MSMTPVRVKTVKTPSQIVHFSFRKIQARREVKTGLLSGVSQEQTDNHSRVAKKRQRVEREKIKVIKLQRRCCEKLLTEYCANNPFH